MHCCHIDLEEKKEKHVYLSDHFISLKILILKQRLIIFVSVNVLKLFVLDAAKIVWIL